VIPAMTTGPVAEPGRRSTEAEREAFRDDRPRLGARLVLTKLEEALNSVRPHPATAPSPWPAHCLGAIGLPGPPTGG
jgi:hypothetical protein